MLLMLQKNKLHCFYRWNTVQADYENCILYKWNEMIIRYTALTSANTVPLLHCPFYEVDNSHPLNEILKCIILSVFKFFFKHHMCVWSMLIFVICINLFIMSVHIGNKRESINENHIWLFLKNKKPYYEVKLIV